jgi:thioredoxin-related protein
MKALRFVFAAVLVTFGHALSRGAEPVDKTGTTLAAEWLSDYDAAVQRATAEKKPLLLDFTGSDWCIWCKRLDAEVFSQRPFIDYARQNLVLVEVDFPATKPQSSQEKQRNRQLAHKYSVSGYPTVVLVDAPGHELGRTGYMEGGAKTFVRELKRIAAAK